MDISKNISDFIAIIHESITNNTFVKISLGNYKGNEEKLKNIYIKKIIIKTEEKISFNYRYQTRDIVKNYALDESCLLIENYLKSGFKIATIFTTKFDIIFEEKKGIFHWKENIPTHQEDISLEHNRVKNRLITTDNKSFLHELNITDKDGNVFKNTQDKYKQINHYIELLSPLLKEIEPQNLQKVVDMGSGKGYLTFALADYLHHTLQIPAQVIGVEYRQDLVDLCNKIAQKTSFQHLQFVQNTIENYDSENTNVLIALHACDTATDDAIAKGINANAELIVVAPCCHKQIRREIEKNKPVNDLHFMTKHGIFLERHAEMVTDGIRSLILEYFGYKTKIFQFISDVHTPKNVMIVGVKNKKKSSNQAQILAEIKKTKEYFGIGYHHLERVMKL